MSLEIEVIKNEIKLNFDLSEKQFRLLQYAMLPKAMRPKRAFIIGKIGITLNQYYDWLRHPKFNEARRQYTKQFYQDDVPDILMAMKHEALAGNERAARLFLEYVADWDKKDLTDPEKQRLPIPIQEVNIIIKQLEQKFYVQPNSDQRPVIEAGSTI